MQSRTLVILFSLLIITSFWERWNVKLWFSLNSTLVLFPLIIVVGAVVLFRSGSAQSTIQNTLRSVPPFLWLGQSGLVIALLLSLVGSPFPGKVLNVTILSLLQYALLLIVTVICLSPEGQRRTIHAWLTGTSVVAALAIYQFIIYKLSISPTLPPERWISALGGQINTLPADHFTFPVGEVLFIRPSSTFIDTNTAAGILATSLLLIGVMIVSNLYPKQPASHGQSSVPEGMPSQFPETSSQRSNLHYPDEYTKRIQKTRPQHSRDADLSRLKGTRNPNSIFISYMNKKWLPGIFFIHLLAFTFMLSRSAWMGLLFSSFILAVWAIYLNVNAFSQCSHSQISHISVKNFFHKIFVTTKILRKKPDIDGQPKLQRNLAKRLVLTGSMVVGFVVILVSLTFVGQRFIQTIQLSDESSQGRVQRFAEAINLWQQHPITGSGAGTFSLAYEKYIDPTIADAYSHMIYLEWLVETGALGFVFHLAFFVGIAVWGWKKAFQTRDPILAGTTAGVTTLLIANLVYAYLGIMPTFILLGLLIGRIRTSSLFRSDVDLAGLFKSLHPRQE